MGLVHVQVPNKIYIYLQLSSRHPISIVSFYTVPNVNAGKQI